MLTEQKHVGEDEGKVGIRSPRVKRDYGPMATLPVWGWCGYGITLHVMGANERFQSFSRYNFGFVQYAQSLLISWHPHRIE